MGNEIWKDVIFPENQDCFNGIYQASNLGRVRSKSRMAKQRGRKSRFFKGKILKQYKNKPGYLNVDIHVSGKRYKAGVHRLVAMAFIPNPQNLECVNHLDENKHNNRVENLEWCTYKENLNYSGIIENNIKKNKVPVSMIDPKNLKVVHKFKSCKEAAEHLKITTSRFSYILKKSEMGIIYRGYLWKHTNKVLVNTSNNCKIQLSNKDI
ncbi:hypothetical protein BGL41_04620 [Fructilactobacillus sanfranciscensis]|uniref:NUMOD4 domain-containing protein n=1 Tax=Fructilactobacillus sanfranciscensis TaxID=1625 RepID=UPI000CD42A3A|nr:NUMOD4 domain-containing protein [Fructilactobacillus sanfranciscensis]POH13409.1 hypothetical protein BGL41_04620 [Fructilactobacillus sanfranciscensis]